MYIYTHRHTQTHPKQTSKYSRSIHISLGYFHGFQFKYLEKQAVDVKYL